MRFKSLGLATLCVGFLAVPALAHHSHGNYQMTEYTILNGIVKEIHWITPHSWIYLEVIDENGEPATWALEGAGVTQLRRLGWTEDSVKVDDPISVRCHQLRDGSNGCLLGFVTPEGGVEKMFD
jgi:hypothetical protein